MPDAVPGGAAGGRVAGWVVSARSAGSVRAQAGRLAGWLQERGAGGEVPGAVLAGAGLVLAGRSRLEYRAAVAGASAGELAAGLAELAGGGGQVTRAGRAGLAAVLFSGQGAQRCGMGRELHAVFPVFAAAWDQACAELGRYLPGPVQQVAWGDDEEELAATGWAQPALFAHGVALFRLLESWGLRPAMVAGHSVGELAAAHVAGALPLADAARLVAVRGRLMQGLPGGGAMAAVAAGEGEVAALLEPGAGIAAVNGPSSVVVSGERGAVAAVVRRLEAAGRRTSWLRVSHAFHSPLMEPVLDGLREAAAAASWSAPEIALVSTLTGQPADAATLADPGYWARQAREPVRFADAVAAMAGRGAAVFVKAGPSAALTPLARAAFPEAGPADGAPPAWRPARRGVHRRPAARPRRGTPAHHRHDRPGSPRHHAGLGRRLRPRRHPPRRPAHLRLPAPALLGQLS